MTIGWTLEPLPALHILPVVHERVELAAVARAALDRLDPAAVAVELPTTLAAAAGAAVKRLPRISVVISEAPGARPGGAAEDPLIWVVAPGDPLVEALRWAAERDRPSYCIDPDLPPSGPASGGGAADRDPERPRPPEDASPRWVLPDPYALWALGPEVYLGALRSALRDVPPSAEDRRREAGMAHHLLRARERLGDGRILALVGAVHAERLAERLREPQAHPLARVRRPRVVLHHLHPDSLTGLLPDPPLAHAVWERVRDAPPEPATLAPALSRKVSIVRFGLKVIAGLGGEEEAARRARLLAYAAWRGTRPGLGLPAAPDRLALSAAVWRVAAGSYREQTGEPIHAWQRRIFFDFARRCARVAGALAPGLYEWTMAARGVADDNLAWEVFDAGRCYPWQDQAAELPVARLDGSELDLGTRRIRFRRRFLRIKQRPVPVPVSRRRAPADPADWLRAFDDTGMCSYPPEDLVIEDYGRFLQKKATSILSAERRHSEPFTTSLLDGIDIRETLRHRLDPAGERGQGPARRIEDARVWVEELRRAPGRAGAVVVIFERDPLRGGEADEAFPFRMAWLGENDQESDMAFYSTPPGEQVVGPGILRATYGGFMLTTPRGRLGEVWSDPDYRFAQDKADVLIMAAVDYSVESLIVHVGSRAPGRPLHAYAAAQGKRLVHIPLASLSPVTLRKIRAVHILAGRAARRTAREYIW